MFTQEPNVEMVECKFIGGSSCRMPGALCSEFRANQRELPIQRPFVCNWSVMMI
jgi:hypothetical protein